MPRVKGFTEKQKREYEMDKWHKDILKGVFAYKGIENKRQKDLAEEFGLSENTIGKLLKGFPVELTLTQWLKIVSVSGMEVRKREDT